MTYLLSQPPGDEEVWEGLDRSTNAPPGMLMGVRRQGGGTPRWAVSIASPPELLIGEGTTCRCWLRDAESLKSVHRRLPGWCA